MKLYCLAIAFIATIFSACPASMGRQVDSYAFEIETLANEKVAVPSTGFTVVCFLGIECPLSKLYGPRLNGLAKEFESAGFQFVAINSNQQDSEEEWKAFAGEYLQFAAGKDRRNVLADKLNVVRNPEVIVFDQQGEIRYRGRIDNQFMPGVRRLTAGRDDLRRAMEELAAGKKVTVQQTEPEGCLIGRVREQKKQATVTYANEISRIFQKHCIECHRPNAIGPFSLTDYDEIVGWSDMILETIDNQRMPPWHADPAHGEFLNSRVLSEQEKQLIRTWVAEGSPRGDLAQLPKQKIDFTESWRLPREPDLVIPMSKRAFRVPAEGIIDYQYFVVDPGFEEDRWISAAEVVPGNRSVVHHSLVFIKPPDAEMRLGANLLGGYVPGQQPLQFKAGRGQKIPAGSKLIFQQHYTPNGSPESDITKLGLVFMNEEEVQEELFTVVSINQEFEILPHQSDAVVEASFTSFPKGGQLLSISPHMHYRGKSFRAVAKMKDGKSEVVLSVPNYDFNWQHIYEFKRPLDLDQIASIEMEVRFDNSENNPFNPNPDEYVVWGDQTWEEMAVGFFNITRPLKPGEGIADSRRPSTANELIPVSAAGLEQGEQFAKLLIAKNDTNGDKQLESKELPLSTRSLFDAYDSDQDGYATFEEIKTAAGRRYDRERRKSR